MQWIRILQLSFLLHVLFNLLTDNILSVILIFTDSGRKRFVFLPLLMPCTPLKLKVLIMLSLIDEGIGTRLYRIITYSKTLIMNSTFCPKSGGSTLRMKLRGEDTYKGKQSNIPQTSFYGAARQ